MSTSDTPEDDAATSLGNLPGLEDYCIFGDLRYQYIQPTNAELALIRIRVIALENIFIALLSDASDQQLAKIRDMARYISPRPGSTPHPLTVHAATHMNELVDRSDKFREKLSP